MASIQNIELVSVAPSLVVVAQSETITLQRGLCPFSGKMAFALYKGDFPIIPVTIYLRHLGDEIGLADNTVANNAYALSIFFTFLQEAGLLFWELTPGDIKKYKRYLLGRGEGDGGRQVRRNTIQQYLNAVKGLVQYWRGLQDSDPFFDNTVAEMDGNRFRRKRHGMLLHTSWYSYVPNKTWRVKIPPAEKHNKQRYKGMSTEDCRAVIRVLNRESYHTDIQKMLYYRDRAIWTFMLMTALRKGELVRIRWDDVDQQGGIIKLRDRPEDSWLGELKTGPGEIFVTSINPYWSYLDEWLIHGRLLAEKLHKARGKEVHGMLFCNRDGGPLTQPAVDHLFLRLKDACKFDSKTFFSPHITRHTIACLMLNSGADIVDVQKLLRHQCFESTRIYAQVSDKKLRASLESFWGSFDVSL